MAGNTDESLTFGFDIGIASVGWCVLGEDRIVNLGVRCFDKPSGYQRLPPLPTRNSKEALMGISTVAKINACHRHIVMLLSCRTLWAAVGDR